MEQYFRSINTRTSLFRAFGDLLFCCVLKGLINRLAVYPSYSIFHESIYFWFCMLF
jgi:hypothetical protein